MYDDVLADATHRSKLQYMHVKGYDKDFSHVFPKAALLFIRRMGRLQRF